MSLLTTTCTLTQVKEYLDELLQVADLDECGNGLALGGWPEITKVGLAVNCSFQAIESAAERGCQLLITHHAPGPSTDATLTKQKDRRLHDLGINLYVTHDCLDQAREFGTADTLARAVGVAIRGPFKPDGNREFGVHGMTTGHIADFVTRVSSQLGTLPRVWKNNDSFGHVAVIAGWGGRPRWMSEALSLGCDTFLTGEANMFGMLFAKEAHLNLVLAGHYVTETPGMIALGARIARDLRLDVTFIPEAIVEGMG